MSPLSKMLHELCKARGWTLTRLAKESAVPKATLHSWTNGTSPNVEQLKRVADTLKVSLHKLAFGEPDPHETEGEAILREIFSGDVRVTLHRIERRRS